ncbi:MAG TPA: ABC transporter ATP-binding protein [Anaerolineae bacterium]|nr:ABC transporter ATP-binding protein [Anaerolineae bacterium]HIQ06143.1 ABC transporter ATP-binding protein [Anaerolineae bacterium]
MRTLWRLAIYLKPHWKWVLATYLGVTVSTGLNLVVPWLIKQVIDVGLARGERRFMLIAAGAILLIALMRSVFGFWQRYGTIWLAQRVAYDLRNQLYDHIQQLPFSFHDHTQTGQLMSRASNDVRSIMRWVGFGLLDSVNLIFLLTGILTILFITHWRLALVALLPVPALVVFVLYFASRIRPLWKSVQAQFATLTSVLQENLAGAQVVRAFAREPYEVERFAEVNQELMDRRLRTIRTWGSHFPRMVFTISLSTALILLYGGRQVIDGSLSVGTVVAFNGYALMLAMPVFRLGWIVNLTAEAIATGERIFEILDTELTIRSAPDATELPRLRGEVRFENVSFAYAGGGEFGDGGATQAVLHEINLHARPGEVIALVGHTGSGKSTLANLIPRFYEVTGGRITVDGIDIRRAKLSSLRRQIGVVLQDTFLFSATVRENIAYGRPDADEAEIIAAAKAAYAHDFIMGFPDGYDTEVGERGITLSGGQRQRIAIARALLMDPRILILDDSTSSVDVETEYLIQRALASLMQGRTSFVIAQRLTTVKHADQILVMDRGRIVERGRHEELLAQGGVYREIYDLQLRDQEELAQAAL